MSRTVIVIDDEPLIAAGLSEKIDWKALDCHMVGTASNGTDGLKLIDQLAPDIVISDIVMPGCTGIELAQRCRREHPGTKIILLSAYSEFEYAQQAIRLNIVDYVLKPVDSEKLIGAVNKAVKSLDEEERLSTRVTKLETDAVSAKEYISSSLLFDIARHGVGAVQDEYGKYLDALHGKPGMVLCVKFYNVPREADEKVLSGLLKSFATHFRESGFQIFWENSDGDTVFLCCLPDRIDVPTAVSRVERTADQAVRSMRAELPGTEFSGMVCACVVSRPYQDVRELKERYRQCLETLPSTFFCAQSGILRAEAKADEAPELISCDDIVLYLKSGKTPRMLEELGKVVRAAEQTKDRDTAMLLLKNLHRHALSAASKAGMRTLPEMTSLYSEENFRVKCQEIEKFLVSVCEYIDACNNFDKRVLLLVEENYGDSDFCLATAAELLGLSSSYLSRVFKKQTGENFLDYLLRFRMEKAKLFLSGTSRHIGQVAQDVGFGEAHYFAQVFKKYCGVTPKQFRDGETGEKQNG